MTRRSITIGKDRFVIGPWHDEPTTAYVAMAPSSSVLTSRGAVEQCLELLVSEGYTGAVTAALRPSDAHVFHSVGFDVRETLEVLRHDLTGPLTANSWSRPSRTDYLVRRAHGQDRAAVLDLDRRAFESFWYLGADGLDEALHATTWRRYRVAASRATNEVAGYAVCGRAADIGYLQRLAVHPDHLRQGIGIELVVDALRWLKRRRSHTMLVNTQESNQPALSLYQHLGFRVVDDRLSVMSWQKP